jgi:hypothetical protein
MFTSRFDAPRAAVKAAVTVCWLLTALAALAVVACEDDRPVTGIDAATPADGGTEGGDAASD